MTSAVDSLASALYRFLANGPKVEAHRDPSAPARLREIREEDLDIQHFRQQWANTAMMFVLPDVPAGQGFTYGYTTVITHAGRAHVFCAGRYAYAVDADCDNLVDDLREGSLADMQVAATRYDGYASA